VPEENFWTLWCKRRLTEADTPTIWLGDTPSGLTSAHLHHPPFFIETETEMSQKVIHLLGEWLFRSIRRIFNEFSLGDQKLTKNLH